MSSPDTTDRESVARFLGSLRKSGLLDEDQIAQVVGSIAEWDSDQALSKHLLAKGVLTEWQTRKLLEGKHKGFVLGDYRLLDRLSAAEFRAVYLPTGRRVPIVLESLRNSSSRLRSFYEFLVKISHEGHPRFVSLGLVLFEAERSKIPMLIVEKPEGPTLHSQVYPQGSNGPARPLAEADAIQMLVELCEAVEVLHDHELWDLELIPGQIYLTQKGARLLAHPTDDMHQQGYMSPDDTPRYNPPEPARDRRCDVFRLGCLLSFAMTGRPLPFWTMAEFVFDQEAGRFSPQLLSLARAMTETRPASRPDSVGEVAAALRKL